VLALVGSRSRRLARGTLTARSGRFARWLWLLCPWLLSTVGRTLFALSAARVSLRWFALVAPRFPGLLSAALVSGLAAPGALSGQ
jgi:hypothetical protein